MHDLVEREGNRTSRAFHLRQARIEHLAGADQADLLGHVLGGGDALDQHGNLVRGPVAVRFHRAHHAVAAIDGVMKFITGLAEAFFACDCAQAIISSICAIEYGSRTPTKPT